MHSVYFSSRALPCARPRASGRISRPSFLAILQQKQPLARVYKRYRALANSCLCCSLISPTDVISPGQHKKRGVGVALPPRGCVAPTHPPTRGVGLESALILFRFHFKLTKIKFFYLLRRFNSFRIYSNIIRVSGHDCFQVIHMFASFSF